jgi:hypothetical protein
MVSIKSLNVYRLSLFSGAELTPLVGYGAVASVA